MNRRYGLAGGCLDENLAIEAAGSRPDCCRAAGRRLSPGRLRFHRDFPAAPPALAARKQA